MLVLSLLVTLISAVSIGPTGCGDDVKTFKPPGEEDSFLPLTSPENVIHNLAASYNLRDFDHFKDLIRTDFTFIFNAYDVQHYAGMIPMEGWWGAPEELQATRNMFDTDWVPDDPKYKVDNIQMALALSDSLVPTNLQGAPAGTLQGNATLDLEVSVDGGQITLLVHSHPLFYFASDSGETTGPWRLWKCADAPYGEDFLTSSTGGQGPDCGATQGGASWSSGPAGRRDASNALAIVGNSWGLIKSVYQ
jgi:hypothetical protein